jgi:hypothetical protein
MSVKRMRMARLRDVFDAGEERQLNAKLARVCVLFEDLRIEVRGIAELSIAALDVLDSEQENQFAPPHRTGRYRRYYFVRRSISTIREFAEALRLLNSDPGFHISPSPISEEAVESGACE